MAATDDQPQTRFRIDLTGPQGRVVSTYWTDSKEEAVRAFAELAKADFGKDLGRGANVALVDREQRLDAARVAEGHGVYNMRFLRVEGRAAYEAIQPSPPGLRYPVDLPGTVREATLDRPREKSQLPRSAESSARTDTDRLASSNPLESPAVMRNETTAHRAQPEDDAKTAALRRQVVAGLTTGKAESHPRRSEGDVEWRDGSFRPSAAPAVTGDVTKAARDVLARASEAELLAYSAARARSPEAAQQVLDTAKKRIEGELESPSGTQRRPHRPVEDRFNIVRGAGIRTYQFRDQPEKVAFTERWLSMDTTSNSAAVVRAMVDRAEERGWTGMRLAGSEEFKRQAWIAAEARGIKAAGYEPTQSDRAASKQEKLRLEKARSAGEAHEAGVGRTMTREGARAPSSPFARSGEERREPAGPPLPGNPASGYAHVMVELERAMALKSVPEAQRISARIAVQRELDALARQDKAAKVKLYDPAASRQTTWAAPKQQVQRAEPERAR